MQRKDYPEYGEWGSSQFQAHMSTETLIRVSGMPPEKAHRLRALVEARQRLLQLEAPLGRAARAAARAFMFGRPDATEAAMFDARAKWLRARSALMRLSAVMYNEFPGLRGRAGFSNNAAQKRWRERRRAREDAQQAQCQ